ncbi:MAG: radical SAM protein [Bacteroides sp.]|nr:radical SAM protein [Bacteroides sp.]
MKLSIYNSYLPLDDASVLVFNAMEDSFLSVFGYCFDGNTPLDEIRKNVTEETWDNLVKGGVVVEKEKDEIEELRALIKKVDEDDSIFILHVNPTLDCNFKCWYCYETHKPGSRIDSATTASLLSLVESIIQEKPNLRAFDLSFFGGEPLLAFDEVLRIIRGVKELLAGKEIRLYISFTTNAYLLDEDKIEKLMPYRPGFQITLDGGPEHHDKTRFEKGGKPSFKRIFQNITRCVENDMAVTLRVNFTTKNIDSVSEIVERLKEISENKRTYLSVDFQRVWQDGGRIVDETYEKAKEYRSALRALGYHTPNNRIIHGVMNSCYGDKKNYLLVNYNGDVYCCTAREFSSANRMGRLTGADVEWEAEKRDAFLECKFSQPVCWNCRIAPLCGGGCRRQAMEHIPLGEDCMYNRSDSDIDELILERFEERYINNHN